MIRVYACNVLMKKIIFLITARASLNVSVLGHPLSFRFREEADLICVEFISTYMCGCVSNAFGSLRLERPVAYHDVPAISLDGSRGCLVWVQSR